MNKKDSATKVLLKLVLQTTTWAVVLVLWGVGPRDIGFVKMFIGISAIHALIPRTNPKF